jgi:hypothetical protein
LHTCVCAAAVCLPHCGIDMMRVCEGQGALCSGASGRAIDPVFVHVLCLVPDLIVAAPPLQEKQKQAGSGEPGAAAAEAQPAAKLADSKRKTQAAAPAKPAAKPAAKPVAKATADKPAAAASHKVSRWCCPLLLDCTAHWVAHCRPGML